MRHTPFFHNGSVGACPPFSKGMPTEAGEGAFHLLAKGMSLSPFSNGIPVAAGKGWGPATLLARAFSGVAGQGEQPATLLARAPSIAEAFAVNSQLACPSWPKPGLLSCR